VCVCVCCCVCCVLRSQLEVTPLANKTKINPNVQDANGKTALHYVVNPLDFGSYENVKLLALLVKSGADVNIKDKQGTAFPLTRHARHTVNTTRHTLTYCVWRCVCASGRPHGALLRHAAEGRRDGQGPAEAGRQARQEGDPALAPGVLRPRREVDQRLWHPARTRPSPCVCRVCRVCVMRVSCVCRVSCVVCRVCANTARWVV
jgi:hypothetical protein